MSKDDIVSWLPTVVPLIYLGAFALVILVAYYSPRNNQRHDVKKR